MTTPMKAPHAGGTAQYRPHTASPMSYTIGPDPKGLVPEKHLWTRGCTPTDERGFVTPKFWGLVRLYQFHMVTAGWAYPQGWPHGLSHVFHIPPTSCDENAISGF